MSKEEHGLEIDLFQLFGKFLENAKYIILTMLVLGLVGLLCGSMLIKPIYQASAKMIVNTRKDESQNVTNDQINSAKNLVETYAVIIRSRDVLNQVIGELNLTDSYEQLASAISVNAVNGTQIMQVSVLHRDQQTALRVTEKILEIAPGVIVEAVEAGSVKTVEQAYVNPNSVSPSVLKYAVLLAIIGFVLSCAIVFVVFLLDNTYKTNIDIQRDLDIPVLGVIPAFESCRSHSRNRQLTNGRN